MVIVSGGIKGGSGKTTAAVNLAVMRALSGRDVLLVDADDQATATDFSNLRAERDDVDARFTSIALREKAVRTEVLRLREKYDDVVVDTGGRDTASQRAALSVADVLLVPFVPRSFDVWTLDRVSELVKEMSTVNEGIRAYAFLNRADHQGRENDEAAAYLQEGSVLTFVSAPLGHRKAYANAASLGLGVVELRPPDVKATAEAARLYEVVFGEMFEVSSLSQSTRLIRASGS